MVSFVLFLSMCGGGPPSDENIVVENARVKLIREVRVPATEAGKLMELNVQEGDLVKAGQTLGRIDDELIKIEKVSANLQHEIAKEKSENDVDERFAKKSLAAAQAELKLSMDAVGRVAGSISETELQRLRLVVEKASLSIEQSQRDSRIAELTKQLKQQTIQTAGQQLLRRRITAPINGMVVEVFTQAGEWATPGEPIVRIIQLDRMRIEVDLDGSQYGAELYGRQVQFCVKVPPGDREESFDGKVTFVSPEIQPVTGEVRVWAEVENRDLLLRPGVHGTLTINRTKPVTPNVAPATKQ